MKEEIIKINFPEKEWLESLLLDTYRETYHSMSSAQKRLIRLAYFYGKSIKQEQK